MVCPVIDRALRTVAVGASAIIALSFVLFAAEQMADASKAQQSAVVDPGAAQERARAEGHTTVREAIDDANDVLTQPFAGVVDSGSIWAKRGVTTLLALLAYGVIARILIGYLPGRR